MFIHPYTRYFIKFKESKREKSIKLESVKLPLFLFAYDDCVHKKFQKTL